MVRVAVYLFDILDPTNIPVTAGNGDSMMQVGADVTFSGNKEYEVQKRNFYQFQAEDLQKKLKDIQALKVPIWKLKPTELPQKPWYAEDLSLKRTRNGKLLDEVGAKKQEENETKLKEMYDPLRVGILNQT